MSTIGASLGRQRTRSLGAAVVTAALAAYVVQQTWGGVPLTFSTILSFLVGGVALGSIYGVAAQGLVVTYATSGVFNFAQGAIGMFMAFVYWELRVDIGMSTLLAVILTVGVAAPLSGIVIERVLMRRLADATIVAQLVVTIGLMLALVGLAASVWNPDKTRVIPRMFGDAGFQFGDSFIPYYRLTTIITGLVIGIGLRWLLYHTRLGMAMRAVVDNRDLTVLNGARPARATMTAWALGSAMAALAGIFLSEELSALDAQTLTLFIVDAFAAGIIARLKSLPMAYVGGLIIGLTLAFQQNFLTWTGRWTPAPSAIPAIILFIALMFVPHGRIEGRPKPRKSAERIPSWRTASIGFAFLIAGAIVCAAVMQRPDVRHVTVGILTAFVMLSLIPLTGWANQISLAQITLVGAGAFALVHWNSSGNLWGLVLATAFAVPVGVIMAGPALRLQGLYLALATMAFARMAEYLFFDQPNVFGSGDASAPTFSVFGKTINQPFDFLGISFAQDGGFLIFATVMFVIAAVAVLTVRRRPFGRRLIAIRDSPAACTTLGLNITFTKLGVFAFSAGIAGLSGGLFAIYYGSVGTADFQLVTGLPYLLLLVVGGVASIGGAVFGGIALVSFSWLTAAFPNSTFFDWFQKVGPGLAGIGIGQNPDGAWEQNVQAFERLRTRLGVGSTEAAVVPARPAARLEESLHLAKPRQVPEGAVLELRDVSVRFGGLQAVKNVDIQLVDGTITGLIGPNGAGKTTLFNVATGLQEPNTGHIIIDGADVTGARPHKLARLGLARTFQRLEVFGSLSVRDNIKVAAEMHRRWSHDRSVDADAVADALIDRLGLQDVASLRADALSTGTARLVEVGRALASQPRVLLLDEPSSGLSSAETETFASLLRELASTGVTILIVEHDMGFIMGLCSHIVVMDAGEVIATGAPSAVQTNPRVLEAYLGSNDETAAKRVAVVREPEVATAAGAEAAIAALELSGVWAGYGGIDVLHDLNLRLERGKVCALLGPNGAGKSTTLKVAAGQLPASRGWVQIEGNPILKRPTDRLVREGLCVIPEGRGIFPNLTVTENLKIASYAGTPATDIIEQAFARFPQLESRRKQLAGTMSGGEQQMLAIARALAVKPQVLMVDELSMGLAPKIVQELYEVLAQIAREGLSILVVEQFAHEVLKVADVAALLIHGTITHQGDPTEINDIMSSAYLGGSTSTSHAEKRTLTEA